MLSGDQQLAAIPGLREQIRAIEQAPASGTSGGGASTSEAGTRVPTGWAEVDAALGGGLAAGAVHEWFSLGVGGEKRPSNWRPPLAVLTHLARQAVRAGGWAVWVGRSTWPYGHGLVGGEGGALLERSLFVDPPDPPEAASRLWAMDLAVRCPGVSVVIGDGCGFDIAATRRLQLAARDANSPVMLARDPTDQGEVSAAATRWWVSPVLSPTNQPRWQIELMRCKGMQGASGGGTSTDAQRSWVVELNRATGLVTVPAEDADRATPAEPPESPEAPNATRRSA